MFSRWPRNLQPLAGRRDVVGGALALGLHEHRQLDVVVAVPRRERLEQLEPLASRARRRPRRRAPSSGGARKPDSPGSKPAAGRSSPTGGSRRDALARVVGDRVGERVELERAGEGVGDDHVGRRDERLGVGVAVVALREVAVVAVDDRVDLRRVEVGALPLADARAAGVGEHLAADRLEVGEEPVALDRGPHLLGAGRDEQLRLGPEALGRRLPGDRRGAGDVLVGRVRARADEGATTSRWGRR